jgi:hypothetical protein
MSFTVPDSRASDPPTRSAAPDEPPQERLVPPGIDVERLTRLVYRLMLNDLALGRERGA